MQQEQYAMDGGNREGQRSVREKQRSAYFGTNVLTNEKSREQRSEVCRYTKNGRLVNVKKGLNAKSYDHQKSTIEAPSLPHKLGHLGLLRLQALEFDIAHY